MGENCSECRKAENRFLEVFQASAERRDKEIAEAKAQAEQKHLTKILMARRERDRVVKAHEEGRHAQ